MAKFYTAGEKKTRPGIYQRYVNTGSVSIDGVETGVVAIPIQSSWGVLGEVTVHESTTSIKNTYGTDGTVDAAIALFEGGASKVYCCRLNAATGGTAGVASSVELKNASSTAVLTVTAKYEGERKLSVSVRSVSGTSKELVVYDGNVKIESFVFESGTGIDEAGNLVSAIASSEYITATANTADDKTVAIVSNASLTGGKNPAITTESYSSALNALEGYTFNYIALDTVDSEVQAILVEWLNRVYKSGKLVVSVLGGKNSTATFDEMKNAARSFDSKLCVRHGIYGRDSNGKVVDGYRMASLVCGAIANTPTTESIVHKTVPGISIITPFTNTEYEDAIKSGLLLASVSSNGTVWFDSGINTLVNPASDEDDGWKKIRRVATRFELLNRIDAAVAPLVGTINCDNDGVSIFIQTAQSVLDDMVAEGKLLKGAKIAEDKANPHSGDSAWFIITADDIDSFEKGYITYQFRFSSNS